MKHFGDITKLDGYSLPPVDIITGGSPCQDLSVAGKRAGLAGDRSGLFMEQMRIIKEMREHDRRSGRAGNLVRPRYMVWENVPGAFSSNKGEDFRAVLEETARIADENAVIPGLAAKQKWSSSGAIMGDGWSIAWRVHDAQFWGVPQRRRRVSLVADFGGPTAPEILFERESVSRDFKQGAEEREKTAGSVKESLGETSVKILNPYDSQGNQVADSAGVYPTLRGCGSGGYQQGYLLDCQPALATTHYGEPVVLQSNQNNAAIDQDGVCFTLPASAGMGGGYVPMIVENYPADSRVKLCEDGIVQTLSSWMGTGGNNTPMVITVDEAYCIGNGRVDQLYPKDIVGALNCMHDQKSKVMAMQAIGEYKEASVCSSLKQRDYKDATGLVVPYSRWSVVRRLTPLECERLQNFPDNWTNIGDWVDSKGKTHKGEADSPRYKALGNSIALPFWQWLAYRLVPHIDHEPTMASLFDGIGGFPLVFSRAGCKPVWASEIEEFPIAVTKVHFPEEEEKDND